MDAAPGRLPWTPLVLGAIAVCFAWILAGTLGFLPGVFPDVACAGGQRVQYLLLEPTWRSFVEAIAGCGAEGYADPALDAGGRLLWFDSFLVVPAYVALLVLCVGALAGDLPRTVRLGALAGAVAAGLADLTENGALLAALAHAAGATPPANPGRLLTIGYVATQVKWYGLAVTTTVLGLGLLVRRRPFVAIVGCVPAGLGALVAGVGAALRHLGILSIGGAFALAGLAVMSLVAVASGPWGAGASRRRRIAAVLAGGLPLALPFLVVLGLPMRVDDPAFVGRFVPAAVPLAALIGAWAWRRMLRVETFETPGYARTLLAATAVGLALVPDVEAPPHPAWLLRATVFVAAGLAWGFGEYGVPREGTRWHALAQRAVASFLIAIVPSIEQALGPWVLTAISHVYTLFGLPGTPPTGMLEGTRLHGALERLALFPWAWLAALHARSAVRYFGAPPDRLPVVPDDDGWIASSREARGVPAKGARVGLALSGGGVRSAAFAGGALAAARAAGFLDRVDVLSVVSGGAWSGVGWWLRARDRLAGIPIAAWTANADYLGITAAKGRRGVWRMAKLVAANVAMLAVTLGVGALWLANALLVAALASLDPNVPGVVLPAWIAGLPGFDWLLAPVPLGTELWLQRSAPIIGWIVLASATWAAPALLRPNAVARALRPLGLLLSLWGVLTATRLAALAPLGFLFAMSVEWRLRRRGWTTGRARVRGAAAGIALVAVSALLGAAGVPGVAGAVDHVGATVLGALGGVIARVGRDTAGLYAVLLVAPALLALAVALRGGPSRAGTSLHDEWAEAIREAFLGPEAGRELHEVLGPPDHRPLLVVGACVNVPNTTDPQLARRHTTPFEVVPTGVGGPTIGWAWVARYRLSLAEVVALSAAAAGSQMGARGDRGLGTVLAFFNLQLGRWLPAPRYVGRQATPDGWLPGLLAELLWDGEERDPDLFVTDGGHHDNSGVLALVRRSCRHAVYVDAEADAFTRAGEWHQQLRDLLARMVDEEGFRLVSARAWGGGGPGPAEPVDALLQDPAWRDAHPTCAVAFELTHPERGPLDLLVLRLARPTELPSLAVQFAGDPLFPAWPSRDQGYTPARFAAIAALGASHEATLRSWARHVGLAAPPSVEAVG